MAEKIVIAELQINTKSLQDSNTVMIQEIGKLRAQQKELSKDTKGLSEATEEQSRRYIENDARLKQLNAEYNNNKRVLAEVTSGVEGLNDLLSQEISRVGDAEQANKKLSLIRSQITTDTQAGRDAIEEINGKIDQNNDFIKENADQLKKQKIGIGDYKTGIKEAFAETDLFSGKLGQVTQVFNSFSPVFNTLNQDIKNTVNQMNVFGKSNDDAAASTDQNTQSTLALSSGKKALAVATNIGTGALRLFTLALAATGIGLIIVALALLIGYFKTLDPVVDKIEQVMAALGATIRVLQQALASLDFSNLSGKMNEAATAAANLKEAQQDLMDLQSSQEVANAKASQQYDELILKSKNRTLTEKERIEFLNQAQAIETANFNQRAALAQAELNQAIEQSRISGQLTNDQINNYKKLGIAYATYLLNAGKITQDDYDAFKKAELNKTAILAESTKRLEKSQNAEDKLRDDAQSKAEKAQADAQKREDDAIARQKENNDKKLQMMNEELSLFIAKENIKTKTLQESVVYEEILAKKRLDLLDKELEFKKISQTKYEEEKLNIVNESGKKQLENFANNARAEFDLFIQENQTKLEAGKLLNQQLIDEEVRRLDSIRIEKLNQLEISKQLDADEVERKRANNEALTIAETEFLTAKNTIELEFKTQSIADQKALDDQVKEQKLNQLLADRELAVANSATQLEQDLLLAQQGYDAELALLQEKLKKEFLTQEQFDAKVIASQKNLQNQKNLIKADELKRTTDLYVGLGNAAQGLFGKNKALTTALALADTYASANKAYYSQFLPIPTVDSPVRGAIAAGTAVLGGLANVAQINNIKFEKGGLQEIGGNRHSTGGTKFVGEDGTRFEAEQGEIIGVMNRNASRAFMEFNNAYPSGANVTTPNVFASGGFVNQNTVTSSSIIDYDLLAAKIGYNVGQANANLPSPMVAITDINYGQKDYADVVNGANF